MQGRQEVTRLSPCGFPSSPAHAGQTRGYTVVAVWISFIPCAYRADRWLHSAADRSFLHPLRIQGRPFEEHYRSAILPSSPVHTGQTDLLMRDPARLFFIPCAYRADTGEPYCLRWRNLHPLCIQGRQNPVRRAAWRFPSSPAHTGQTEVTQSVEQLHAFIPCAYRADPRRERGPYLRFPSSPAHTGQTHRLQHLRHQ